MASTYDAMLQPYKPVSLQLLDLMLGNRRAGAMAAFAELGIVNAFRTGSVTTSQLAHSLGLERDTCDCCCRASNAVGLTKSVEDKAIELTALGCALSSDSPDSMKNFAQWSGSTADRVTWAHIPTAVRTGRSPFAAAHGTGLWDDQQSYESFHTMPEEQCPSYDRDVVCSRSLAEVTT
ncbi:hypothetical protein [Rhodococcus sp. H29-C3]|uniref:hypothetical protein n=1 Tax=Rhodococcus sp. H29-C3 TaxID=3046307 RepID=UPI0024B8857D|nr:hypothetical protein [Rhodococcus sp. H29-C3]MDJ0362318.1 hypothetical protein [Rhodococcus sp. H29-C3]